MIQYRRRAHILAFALAMLAGFVDVLGFLKLGGFFVSFMSGNSTRLAVGLAAQWGAAEIAGLLIASFVLGVIAGSLVSTIAPDEKRKAVVLATVALALIVAAMLGRLADDRAAIIAMAMAMGCANAVFKREGEVSIGVTYMTGTLVKLGQRIADVLCGGSRLAWVPYLLLWFALIAGAVGGASSYRCFGLGSLWIAAAWAAALSITAWRIDFRAQPLASHGLALSA